MCALLGLACVTGPNNGATFGSTIIGASFSVSGYWVNPSTTIQVQVLSAPSADVNVDANWQTLTTVTSSATASNINGDLLYPWNATIVPVPSSAFAARWPDGGLVKLRARSVETDGSHHTAYTFDEVTWQSCEFSEYGNGTSGENIGVRCQGLGRGVVAMVSTHGNPADLGTRDFLGLKDDHDSNAYYLAWGAPQTLTDFKNAFLYPGLGSEIRAVYYNDGDLGIGRDMHCWNYTLGFIAGTACYVSNYSDTYQLAKFGNNAVGPTLDHAIDHNGPFATVAMVTQHSTIFTTDPGPVHFAAYGSDERLATEAKLDNTGHHFSVPSNCLTCHGVDTGYSSGATFSGRASFLPFDLASFKYSTTRPGYSRASQEEAFRRLNALVRNTTAPAPAITSLIDGAYAPAGVGTLGATWNDAYLPSAWAGSTTNHDYPALYNGVVKPYCRTCHVSARTFTTIDFAEATDFETLKPTIGSVTCRTPSGALFMPQAEHPMRKFWASGARAYLNAWTGDTTGCKP